MVLVTGIGHANVELQSSSRLSVRNVTFVHGGAEGGGGEVTMPCTLEPGEGGLLLGCSGIAFG